MTRTPTQVSWAPGKKGNAPLPAAAWLTAVNGAVNGGANGARQAATAKRKHAEVGSCTPIEGDGGSAQSEPKSFGVPDGPASGEASTHGRPLDWASQMPRSGSHPSRSSTARIWAFGREEVRRKVRAAVADLDEAGTDVFVA